MLFSNHDIRKLIIPLMLEQILGITIGAVDSMMVAGSGESVLSGVSLVNTLNTLSVYLFSAMTTGGSVIISQEYGKGKQDDVMRASKQLVWASFFVALAITIVCMILHKKILTLAFGSVEAEVMRSASVYFFIMLMSYPLSAVNNGVTSVMRVGGDTKTPLKISLLTNVLNVIGNAVFIIVLDMGAAGAAIASLLSLIISTIIRVAVIHRKDREVYIDNIFSYKPDWGMIRRICSIGIPNALEHSTVQFGKILTMSLISGFGTYQIAANSVCGTLANYQLIPGGAVCTIMVIIVGRCIGAGEKQESRRYVLKLIRLAYYMTIPVCLIMCLSSPLLMKLYSLSDEAAYLGQKLLLLNSVGMCTLWPLGCIFPSAFRAAGDVKYPMVVSVMSMWLMRISMSYLLGKYMGMGVMGVWCAMVFEWLVKTIIFGLRFIRGTWLEKII